MNKDTKKTIAFFAIIGIVTFVAILLAYTILFSILI